MRLTVSSARPLRGAVRPPSDKSLTHRAYLLAGLAAAGSLSSIRDPLDGEDCIATLRCLHQLGAQVQQTPGVTWITAPMAWTTPADALDCGNSGTTMRLLAGCLAPREGLSAVLVGDESLSRRPMARVADPLRRMGASVEGDVPPLVIEGRSLMGIDYASPVASAQVKSAILLAGLRAEGETWVREPSPSRDHTERMLTALGVSVRWDPDRGVGVFRSEPWGAFDVGIPGDVSSAAFWLVAGALVPESQVQLLGVGVNPTRTGVLDVLAQVGVPVGRSDRDAAMGEPVADLVVEASSELAPFTISGALVPRLIDEIPVLAVLATQCHGRTIIQDAAELRVKESDRIARMSEGLQAMGAQVEPTADGFIIDGPTPLHGTTVDARGDHRLAMAFAVAGMIATGETVIENADSMATSYPDFVAHAEVLQGG